MYSIIITNIYMYLPYVMFGLVIVIKERKRCLCVSTSSKKNWHSSNILNIDYITRVLIKPYLHNVNGDEKDGRVVHGVEEAEECLRQHHLILRHIVRVAQNTGAFSWRHFADFRWQTNFIIKVNKYNF